MRPLVAFGLSVTLAWSAAAAQERGPSAPSDWRTDWAVAEGLALERDTEGYGLPTAIAFVPEPGPGPKDPLYFVTELRGTVKVVTNDRSVHTFARDFIDSRPLEELPAFAGETGLAGICLAPEQGYVFVTFAYHAAAEADSTRRPHLSSNRATIARREGMVLRNRIVRFQAAPKTFSLQPSGRVEFRELFAGHEAAISHQIGGCRVSGNLLYVSVGDGFQTDQSQQVASPLGKVLRMTLDGGPAPGNPFGRNAEPGSAAGYVWAYGFRNPFGLEAVESRLYVADNGMRIDRFLEVRSGENYLWNGDDWSIGARADLFFYPDIGPAQVEYYPGGDVLPEQYARSFLVAASNPDRPGLVRLGYDVERGVATSVPEFILRYQGGGAQIVTGVALGPDGVYVVPTLPDSQGRSAVYRISYRPDRPHPVLLTHSADPVTLMEERGCYACHELNGAGGTIGPPLDREPLVERLANRLESEAYARAVARLDTLDREPYRRYREARAEVLRASGRERIRTWMIYRLMEPKFDNPDAQMPSLGLSKSEATLLTDHLLREATASQRWSDAVLRLWPAALRPWPIMYRHLLLAFAGGLAIGVLAYAVLSRVRRRPGRP